MQIKKNSVLGWIIHIAYSALLGWFFGYLMIPAILTSVFALVVGTVIQIVLGIVIGGTYLYALRSGFDLAFPFKNGGWL